MENRHVRSVGTLTEEGIRRLKQCHVAVVGCGGLGGYILELLSRSGVGNLTAIDGDVFDETNLNRQLLSSVSSLGQSKAETAKKRIHEIDPSVQVTAIHDWLTTDNALHLLDGHDIIVDALDSIDMRFVLQEVCEQMGTPLVHGAIGGWYGQMTVIFPGDKTFDKLYPKALNKGIETELGNPSFSPAIIASLEAAETIKLLLGKGEILRNRVLRVDLLEHDYSLLDL